MVDRHVTHAQQVLLTYGRLRTSDDLDELGLAQGPQNEAAHVLSGMCWCQPIMENDLIGNGRLFIHRTNLDELHVQKQA